MGGRPPYGTEAGGDVPVTARSAMLPAADPPTMGRRDPDGVLRVREVDPLAVATPLPIRTPRLLLRPCREGDGTALAEAVAESYDDLHRWLHRWMREREVEADPRWQEVVACRSLMRFKAREWMSFLAWTEAGALVGMAELILPDWRRGAFELAYWIRSSAHRRGYGTEAAGALVRYAFDALDARLVTVTHSAPNEASARLIAKLGFVRASRMPLASELPDGTLVDRLTYVMRDGRALPALDVGWG